MMEWLAILLIVGIFLGDAVVAYTFYRKRAALDITKPEGQAQAKKYTITVVFVFVQSVAFALLVWFVFRPMLLEI